MTDKELRDAAVKKLQEASNHFKLTTKGYTRMTLPLPTQSQWGQGYEDFNAGLVILGQIGVIEEPEEPSTILPRYGISNGYTITVRPAADRIYELDRCKEAGAKWVRIDTFKDNQPGVEAVINEAETRGMMTMLILHGTARNAFSPQIALDFAKAQATKWKGRPVVYEFCNEPDLQNWTPENYGEALKGSWNGLKEGDPNAKLIAGALWKCENHGGMAAWVERMYAVGVKDHFNAISVHLYDVPTWNDPRNGFYMTFGPGPNIRQVMNDNGDQALPILATEAGSTVTKVSEATQAQRIKEQLADPRCQSMATFSMMDDAVTGFGLLRPDRTKRPSWDEYVKAAS